MIRVAIPAIAAWVLLLFSGAAAQSQTEPSTASTAVAGSVLDAAYVGRVSPETVRAEAAPLFGGYGPPQAAHSVDAYLIRFATTDLDGELVPITAQLFLPVLAEGESATALFAFGAGTTGVGAACAPSREAAYDHPIGHYREYLQAYAAQGFVAIVPDYLGFDDPTRPQAYFHAVAEGRVLLDAIRATFRFLAQTSPDVEPPRHVFTGGYSQGGHAAFAAADLRPTYAPEVPLHGMIGFAPTTNVERLLREGPYYAPYIAVSYASVYGSDRFDPADVLHPRWLPSLTADTAAMCVDRAQAHWPFDGSQMYAPGFLSSLTAGTLDQTHPGIKEILDENRTGLSGHGLPALIVQGGRDVIVRDPTQERFLAELCERDSRVLYLHYPEARHRHTRPAGFEDAVGWMKGIASAGAAPTSCPLVSSTTSGN